MPYAYAPGMRVLCRDAEWLVTQVKSSDYGGQESAVQCVGVDDLVRGQRAEFLTQLDRLEPVDPARTRLRADDTQGYRLSRLYLEAQLRLMPTTSLSPDTKGMGAFSPMSFQEESARRALEQLRPRLLLADAVGLGKTIQVGMILTELMRRGRANRILVLTQKSMLAQFQAELWNRFAVPLVRLDSEGLVKLRLRIPANKNPFEVYHRIIISMDTLKNVARYEHFLQRTHWDVVVIDEAHNVAAASNPERNYSYRLARVLSQRCDAMLLTTATPHNGRRETFGRLISLLDPAAIPDPKLREYDPEDVRGFFMMRFKEDIRAEAGDMLTDREVIARQETSGPATADEETIYGLLADLRAATAGDGTRGDALLQYGLYKLFLSSPEALRSTLIRRLEKLAGQPEAERQRTALRRLLDALGPMTIRQSTRFKVLLNQLRAMGWNGRKDSPRLLIFTEYCNTMEALIAAIAAEFSIPYSVKPEDQARQALGAIDGSFSDVHLMAVVESFATGSSPMRLLVATDVASEGINLHHECHNIIHYDLPWSIITLIQRNGRIDRLGQKRSPILRYLQVTTANGLLSGDDAIFDRLIQKAEEINRLRRPGESLLQLYDSQKEEDYIAREGILGGNVDVLEAPAAAADDPDVDSFLAELLAEARQPISAPVDDFLAGEPTKAAYAPTSRYRLFGDREFLLRGYDHLRAGSSEFLPIEESGPILTLPAPRDLRRRLGAPDQSKDVVFGATAIPQEAWPSDDRFVLSDDPKRVELAITAARNTSGHWSRELMCTQQHPIMQWLAERLVMQLPRGQAPHLHSPHLAVGEIAFCMMGLVSSQRGLPLVVDAHAIIARPGRRDFAFEPLHELLERSRLKSLVNTGATIPVTAAEALLPAAVAESLRHLKALGTQYQQRIRPLIEEEEKRLRRWRDRRLRVMQLELLGLEAGSPAEQRLRDEVDQELRNRLEHWRESYFETAAQPTTRVLLVVSGEKS